MGAIADKLRLAQIPEPDADGLAQLQDMGFSQGLSVKALLLSRNQPAAALEWALQHSDDADADLPPSDDALRAGGIDLHLRLLVAVHSYSRMTSRPHFKTTHFKASQHLRPCGFCRQLGSSSGGYQVASL